MVVFQPTAVRSVGENGGQYPMNNCSTCMSIWNITSGLIKASSNIVGACSNRTNEDKTTVIAKYALVSANNS